MAFATASHCNEFLFVATIAAPDAVATGLGEWFPYTIGVD